jgi:hypothetical protein
MGSSLGCELPTEPPQARNHWLRVWSSAALVATAPPAIAPHRCLPAHSQYARASHQSTEVIGQLPGSVSVAMDSSVFHAHSSGCSGMSLPTSSRNAWYWSMVTSVLST